MGRQRATLLAIKHAVKKNTRRNTYTKRRRLEMADDELKAFNQLIDKLESRLIDDPTA
jgi:hypothetical protein